VWQCTNANNIDKGKNKIYSRNTGYMICQSLMAPDFGLYVPIACETGGSHNIVAEDSSLGAVLCE